MNTTVRLYNLTILPKGYDWREDETWGAPLGPEVNDSDLMLPQEAIKVLRVQVYDFSSLLHVPVFAHHLFNFFP